LGSESETCVGSRVRLFGVPISFEKNFYRLPFTPPSLVCHFGPSHSPARACARSLQCSNGRATVAHHVCPPTRRPPRARLRRLKRRARGARPLPQLRSFNDSVPYRVSVTATWPEPRARETRPRRVRLLTSGLETRSARAGTTAALEFGGLLISSSSAGSASNPRTLYM
jgi:hypothetical protein